MGTACAANYMYEKANIKGIGYKNVEMIVSIQHGFSGVKLIEKESGSGNVLLEKTELEAERQIDTGCFPRFVIHRGQWVDWTIRKDYINLTKEAEFEYMPVSYQTGTYDQKWIEKLCVQNYRIGAVLTEMYTHAEHLQKRTEAKTLAFPAYCEGRRIGGCRLETPCCTGILEASLNAQVIGVAHIGWMSRDPEASALVKGRHIEYGRSVEDLTGVFSIEKFIQLWGNSTCGAISVDWLPCL
ncbi:MAG TPA: hypothetical protein PK918_08155 [Methanotrichaceae archaeon]|nr:hypothetical protein [Methanotrichaceae archaeon]HQI91189.1 hypothetical protein [Methanotrichaceae archaeon]HQJ28412.1 hypothetical protein [Methanotrichaceae archaeon]